MRQLAKPDLLLYAYVCMEYRVKFWVLQVGYTLVLVDTTSWVTHNVRVSQTSSLYMCSTSKLQFTPAVDSRGYPAVEPCALEEAGLVAVFDGLAKPQPGQHAARYQLLVMHVLAVSLLRWSAHCWPVNNVPIYSLT